MKRVFAFLVLTGFVLACAIGRTRAQSNDAPLGASLPCLTEETVRLNQGDTAYLAVPDVPNPLKAPGKPSPTSSPRTYWLENGDTFIHDGQKYSAPKGGEVGIIVPVTPPPTPKPKPGATPTPTPIPNLPLFVQNTNDRTVSVGLTPQPPPTPSPSASPSAETAQPDYVTAEYPIAARAPGTARVTIGNGRDAPRCYSVRVAPGEASKLVFTTGVGASNIPKHTVGASSPAPDGSQYVFFNEKSNGQTFVPLLVNFRFTDFPSRYQFYLSGGFSATGQTSNQLFGLSAGTDYYLFTLGWHSSTYDALQPFIMPGLNTAIPNGAPLTITTRTTRPFASISFPICALSGLFGFTGGGSACATPTPAPSPNPKS